MLAVQNLDLFYGDAQALSDVSLEVGKGEIVAIVGANGAGKSSLIRCIAGIEMPRSGRIAFKERIISGQESHQICNLGIGQVAEGRQVFPSLTVLENLQMGAMVPRAKAGAKRNLDDVFALFPRLAERRQQLAGTMSGGEQQMVAIGRCLMGAPELIMFDEPSLGLAPLVVQEVLHTIRVLNRRGLTILLVEQNVAVSLRISNRAYVLENGRVVMSDTGEQAAARRSRAAGVSGSLITLYSWQWTSRACQLIFSADSQLVLVRSKRAPRKRHSGRRVDDVLRRVSAPRSPAWSSRFGPKV